MRKDDEKVDEKLGPDISRIYPGHFQDISRIDILYISTD